MPENLAPQVARLGAEVVALRRDTDRHEKIIDSFGQEVGNTMVLEHQLEELWKAVRSIRTDLDNDAKNEKETRRWRINTYFLLVSLVASVAFGVLTLVLSH